MIFLQPAERDIAGRENEEDLTSGRAQSVFCLPLLKLFHSCFLQEKCCHLQPGLKLRLHFSFLREPGHI